MFDIINGNYDDYFRKMGQDLKSYGHPILFRMNNEMDCGWVRWSGNNTLLDPDIHGMVWTHIYNIFEEEGVDNLIWVFNPNGTSGFNSWSQWLNYLPKDKSMVHCLGLTYYEPANGTTLRTFPSMYRELYERSTPYFEQHVWVIGEFGCGAGGEIRHTWNPENPYQFTVRARNKVDQSDWVRQMFSYMNRRGEDNSYFINNLKVAVWFSGNDTVTYNDTVYISNYYRITDELTETIEEFRRGFNRVR
jgi:hypothetical protein